ncbi:hypothetical protein CSUB01_09124 [Colletotrichum sublineola]|uniref:Uncharacterized protein n=1 Tax=Colletotrichum sublineola TaxID=1173701 RepID=A0A066XM08_COLSU|nr:hypothetical protein CSUB01_09124 [Colletotrichum sublineola]
MAFLLIAGSGDRAGLANAVPAKARPVGRPEELRHLPDVLAREEAFRQREGSGLHGTASLAEADRMGASWTRPSDVYINTVALHSAPSTRGPDTLAFNPSRWLQPADAAAAVSGDEEEGEVKKGGDGDQSPASQFITPSRGTYLHWSGGSRAFSSDVHVVVYLCDLKKDGLG